MKDFEQILKNLVQKCLEPKMCLEPYTAVHKAFRTFSQKPFPDVSRNIYKGFTVKQTLKNRVQMCLKPKKHL